MKPSVPSLSAKHCAGHASLQDLAFLVAVADARERRLISWMLEGLGRPMIVQTEGRAAALRALEVLTARIDIAVIDSDTAADTELAFVDRLARRGLPISLVVAGDAECHRSMHLDAIDGARCVEVLGGTGTPVTTDALARLIALYRERHAPPAPPAPPAGGVA